MDALLFGRLSLFSMRAVVAWITGVCCASGLDKNLGSDVWMKKWDLVWLIKSFGIISENDCSFGCG